MKKIKRTIKQIIGWPVVLSRHEINKIPIEECGEALIEILETQKLKVNKDQGIFFRKSEFEPLATHILRKTPYQLLIRASEFLPQEYSLLILEGFRPYDIQLLRFEAKKNLLQKQNPHLPSEEIERRARLAIADPRGGAPHQTGGAVDLTIIDAEGVPLDMGTSWGEFNKKTSTKSWFITKIQKRNRKILYTAMQKAGFQNYPGEWWHYSYGDRMWAAYKKKDKAMYGSTEIK